MGMKAGFMTGDFLINLDSEDEGEIFVSCAGGRTTTATLDIKRQPAPEGCFFIKGSVKGLVGGHSGDDINKKRANGLKIIARFVYQEMERYEDIHLVRLHGGSLHNAIPRGGFFVLAVPEAIKENIRADWNVFSAEVDDEFHVTDTQMVWRMRSYDPEPIIDDDTARRFVYALQAVDNGVYAVCQDEALGGMTETSSNLARVETHADKIEIMSSQRSNVMSNLDNMCNTVAAVFKLAGFQVVHSEGYPAWKMRANSELQKIVTYTYHKLFQKNPVVRGIHAGLECGLFAERYPNLDMVSFGPTLRDVHTPDERLLIPTVQMVWDHLLLTLKSMPHQS
jgi:dipeptidase D